MAVDAAMRHAGFNLFLLIVSHRTDHPSHPNDFCALWLAGWDERAERFLASRRCPILWLQISACRPVALGSVIANYVFFFSASIQRASEVLSPELSRSASSLFIILTLSFRGRGANVSLARNWVEIISRNINAVFARLFWGAVEDPLPQSGSPLPVITPQGLKPEPEGRFSSRMYACGILSLKPNELCLKTHSCENAAHWMD